MISSQTAFKHVFDTNKWENRESVSGPGSTRSATSQLLPQLADLISRRAIASLNDAPCGDFNWIAPIAEQVQYRGFDVVPDVIEIARSRADHPFGVLDIVEDVLPRADAILCRDCLVHLPEEMIEKAINNFVRSESRWLLTTTFPELQSNKRGSLGGWRPINLQLEPFNFPEPEELLVERPSIPPHETYGRKALGLWPLSALDR